MSIELYAWVGEDEFGSGEVGIKQGHVPAGYIPLVSIDRKKIERAPLLEQLQQQVNTFGKPMRLVRFVEADTVRALK